MASAEAAPAAPAPDVHQEPNDKVTTIPNPDDTSTENKEDGNAQEKDAQESTPVERESATMTNGHSTDASSDKQPKSYAAAVATNGHDQSTSKEDKEGRDDKENRPDRKGDMRSHDGLDSPPNREPHAMDAWQAGGIRFAPLKVPLVRRMQTAAVLFHCMSIVLIVSVFWFTCANPLSWPILVPYLIHLSTSTASTNGQLAYRSEYLRSLPLWRLFAGYFPAQLHKTHHLPPDRKYIFGYHPHGIISHGAWCAFATNALGFAHKFPGITNSLLTLDSNFRLPFYRDWILAMGIRSVSKESIWNILTKGGPNNDGQGRAVTIVIGGARESLEAQPGSLRLILHDRKGFVKMALRTGADLVPVIGFGENDLYDQLSPKTYPMVHKLQMVLLKVFKFTVPALHGRGVLNYDVGLMPYRRPVNIVVGKPIRVDGPHGAQPSQEDIDRLHELYVQEVERMWEQHKDEFSPNRASEMQIIS